MFIEESLHRIGVINRLSDLREIPNLVLVLDGFDELVMASRSRLRQFFNMLRDEHSAGPLRTAKMSQFRGVIHYFQVVKDSRLGHT